MQFMTTKLWSDLQAVLTQIVMSFLTDQINVFCKPDEQN